MLGAKTAETVTARGVEVLPQLVRVVVDAGLLHGGELAEQNGVERPVDFIHQHGDEHKAGKAHNLPKEFAVDGVKPHAEMQMPHAKADV